jgi:DNA-binding MarR family transcriptional regulator
VLCQITKQGEALLATLDPQIDAADLSAMAMLTPEQRESLLALLAVIRAEMSDL